MELNALPRFAQERWLPGLLNGDIRSAYLMTEPTVAGSDATNISLRAEKNDVVVTH